MRLPKHLFDRPVSELPLRRAITVPPDATVGEAVQKMREEELGCVVVVSEDGKPIGTFSESMLAWLLTSSPDPLQATLVGYMDPYWACVKTTDPIATVLKEMQTKDIRFVCVADSAGLATALTGQKGLVEYVAEHFPRQIQMMVGRVGGDHFPVEREGA